MTIDTTFLEQVSQYKSISKKIAELEGQKKALGIQIMAKMQENTVKVPGFVVRRCSRLSIAVPLEKARQLGATKLEETVDKEKIKNLLNSGVVLEEVSEIQYIQITENRN